MLRTDNNHLDTLDPDINLNLNTDACKYFTVDQFNLGFSNDTSKYFLLNQNIQSFNAKQAVLEAFLESLTVPLHTIVLTETWNDSKSIQLCQIENFEAIHTLRNTPHRGGGVSIFVNSSLYNIKKINELSYCNESIETCVARISRKDNTENEHIVLGIYRPRHDNDENFINLLQEIISNESLDNKTIIVAGDMNIDLLKQNDNYVNHYSCMLKSLNFIQIIKQRGFPMDLTPLIRRP